MISVFVLEAPECVSIPRMICFHVKCFYKSVSSIRSLSVCIMLFMSVFSVSICTIVCGVCDRSCN